MQSKKEAIWAHHARSEQWLQGRRANLACSNTSPGPFCFCPGSGALLRVCNIHFHPLFITYNTLPNLRPRGMVGVGLFFIFSALQEARTISTSPPKCQP